MKINLQSANWLTMLESIDPDYSVDRDELVERLYDWAKVICQSASNKYGFTWERFICTGKSWGKMRRLAGLVYFCAVPEESDFELARKNKNTEKLELLTKTVQELKDSGKDTEEHTNLIKKNIESSIETYFRFLKNK